MRREEGHGEMKLAMEEEVIKDKKDGKKDGMKKKAVMSERTYKRAE